MGGPDWKKPEDYNFLKHLTKSQWAWEFLRRNPEYIASWERYKDAVFNQQEDPGPPADELCGPWKWGIAHSGYIDPEDDKPVIEWLPLLGGTEAFICVPKGGSFMRIFGGADHEKGKVLLQFNFHQPITHQLEKAKKELSRLREESEKRGIKTQKVYKSSDWKAEVWQEEWKILLRIADAKVAGIRDKEIGSILGPNKAEYEQWNEGDYAEDCTEQQRKHLKMAVESQNQKEQKEIDDRNTKWVGEKLKQAMKLINRNYRLILYSEQ